MVLKLFPVTLDLLVVADLYDLRAIKDLLFVILCHDFFFGLAHYTTVLALALIFDLPDTATKALER